MQCPWQCAKLKEGICGECEFDFSWLQSLGWESSKVYIIKRRQTKRVIGPTRNYCERIIKIFDTGIIEKEARFPKAMVDWIDGHRVTRDDGHTPKWQVERIKRKRDEPALLLVEKDSSVETKRRKKDIITENSREEEEEKIQESVSKIFCVTKMVVEESLESLMIRNIELLEKTMAKHMGLRVSNGGESSNFILLANASLPKNQINLSNFFMILLFRLQEDASSLVSKHHFTQLSLRFVAKNMDQFQLRCEFY